MWWQRQSGSWVDMLQPGCWILDDHTQRWVPYRGPCQARSHLACWPNHLICKYPILFPLHNPLLLITSDIMLCKRAHFQMASILLTGPTQWPIYKMNFMTRTKKKKTKKVIYVDANSWPIPTSQTKPKRTNIVLYYDDDIHRKN